MARRSRFARFLGVALLFTLVMSASHAEAKNKHELRKKLAGNVDKALKSVKATPAQRAQVQAAIADVLRTAEDAFVGASGTMPDVADALALFASEHIDPATLAAVRTHREERHARLADALVKAFCDVHGVLDHDQRALLVDFAMEKQGNPRARALKEKVVEAFVKAQVEDVLDQIGASEPERKVAREARDRVLDAVDAAKADRDATAETLANLFRGDELDKAAVQSFRVAQEEKLRTVTDVLEQHLVALHDALTPEHRQKLIALVRDFRAHQRHGANGEPL